MKKYCAVNNALAIAAFVFGVYCLGTQDMTMQAAVGTVLWMTALLYGFLYTYKGYKKSVAQFYKSFFGLLAVSVAADIVISIVSFFPANELGFLSRFAPAALLIVVLVCAARLCFVKDLGKKKSVTAVGIMLAATILLLLLSVFSGYLWFIADAFARLVLSCVSAIMVLCKYADKEARGTK